MAYIDEVVLLKDATFRDRVSMAAYHAAVNVTNEAPPPGMPQKEAKARQRLATSVKSDPWRAADWFLYPIATNPTIAAAGPVNSTDSDLDFVIGSVWSQVALGDQPA